MASLSTTVVRFNFFLTFTPNFYSSFALYLSCLIIMIDLPQFYLSYNSLPVIKYIMIGWSPSICSLSAWPPALYLTILSFIILSYHLILLFCLIIMIGWSASICSLSAWPPALYPSYHSVLSFCFIILSYHIHWSHHWSHFLLGRLLFIPLLLLPPPPNPTFTAHSGDKTVFLCFILGHPWTMFIKKNL